jgi:hypothetical protein
VSREITLAAAWRRSLTWGVIEFLKGRVSMFRVLMAATLATLVVGVAACGGDDGGEPTVIPIEVAPAGDGFELTVPESVEAGLVRLELQIGTEDDAEAQLLRLADGHTIDEALAAIASEDGKIPDWLTAEGGVGTIAPGASGAVELVLEEGTYHVIDTSEPEGDDVQSHAESGATATLEVTSGDDDADLPDVDASIEMADFEFVTDGLQTGTNRFLLRNTGEELHHTLIVPINEGATFEEVKQYMTSEESDSGPPPVDFESLQATTVLDAGREQIDQLELEAGRYALVCFLTNRAGGPPHVALGMVSELTIEE